MKIRAVPVSIFAIMFLSFSPEAVFADEPDMPSAKENFITPDGTYLFAQRDTCDLFLDVYNPAENSETKIGDKEKPTIIFLFGGGFISGARNEPSYNDWYKSLIDNGYRVIAPDYRLGLKGSTKVGLAQVDAIDNAIHLAVEDLFSATSYIIDNASTLGVNPENIVICGSSAGAITVLQADYELCNHTHYASMLPEGFRFAGVVSYSGAILSRQGKIKYADSPAPTLMFHGTADKLVNYKQITFFNIGLFGSDKIAERFKKFGYTYNILRYAGNGHEIAGIMNMTTAEMFGFIKANVMQNSKEIIDMTIHDPRIEGHGTSQSRKALYGEK